jgi:hypothetical protein
VEPLEVMLYAKLEEGILFVELAKVAGYWLWCNGTIGSMLEVRLGYSGRLVVGRVKDKIENIAGCDGPTAWCG